MFKTVVIGMLVVLDMMYSMLGFMIGRNVFCLLVLLHVMLNELQNAMVEL